MRMPAVPQPAHVFADAAAVASALETAGYVPTPQIATVVFLALRLERPVLIEGPAGVGKTAIAQALATLTQRDLIRLQCYEGLDESKALYEWEYAKQLLFTQILRDKIGETISGAANLSEAMTRIAAEEAVFFAERFLLERPLLKAIRGPKPSVLLIDEVDKSDPEFEAFLLELLSDFQVTVPELGTFRASRPPLVVLTSNRVRELSEALKRRCLYLYIDFPEPEREQAIVAKHLPGITDRLNRQLVTFVRGLRTLDLRKPPSLSETIDWARALVVLHAEALGPELVEQTLGVLLKHEQDHEHVRGRLPELLALV